jgi:hypothetical protein
MMTIPEILKELEPYTRRFPMQTAIEQREAITPELLRVLEAVAFPSNKTTKGFFERNN